MKHLRIYALIVATAATCLSIPYSSERRIDQAFVWNQWAEGIVEAQALFTPVTGTQTILAPLTKYITSAASTNATLVSATPGNVYLYSLINTTATIYYLRMYNLAAAPTCSSATGFVETIPVPASTSAAGIQRPQVLGQSFTTGIAYCLTGGGSSTDNTSAATGVYLTILYRGNS